MVGRLVSLYFYIILYVILLYISLYRILSTEDFYDRYHYTYPTTNHYSYQYNEVE